MQVWKHQKKGTAVKIRYREQEEILMDELEKHGFISLSRFARIAGIPIYMAEKILLNFILLDIISMEITETQIYYHLNEQKA